MLDFIRQHGLITMDSIAGKTGEPLLPLAWQERAIEHVFARDAITHRRRHRIAMVSMARKNGKTGLSAPIALYGLTMEGDGAQVFSCAADKDQAKLVFGAARRIVEMDPELSEECHVYKDVIEHSASGSVYRALSSEAFTKEGLSPTLVVYDELHAAPDRTLFDVMSLAMGARVDPLMLIVTTAGVRSDTTGRDSVCYQLYQYGERIASGEVDDPTFFMAWWKASDTAKLDDSRAWHAANPGLGTILDPADLRSAMLRTPEPEFRTKRLNCFVNTLASWLPTGAFEARRASRTLKKGETVVLGFDGSFNGDTTVLVAATFDGFVDVVGYWEKPADLPEWEVPIEEVNAAISAACKQYRVVEIAADPYRWAREIQAWEMARLPAVEYPTTSPARMVPACAKFYDAVMTGRLTHSGDPRLERHVRNAILKVDRLGPRIVKEHRGSPRKIDLAVAGVMAYDRATWHAANTPPKPPSIFFV